MTLWSVLQDFSHFSKQSRPRWKTIKHWLKCHFQVKNSGGIKGNGDEYQCKFVKLFLSLNTRKPVLERGGGVNNKSTDQPVHLGRMIRVRERSGSVVECLTRDRRAAGSSLTGVTALWSLSKTHLS